MTAQNDFLPFATAGGANVESQASFQADSTTGLGFQSGVAASSKLNKVWRQGSFVAAAIAQLLANNGIAAYDDGDFDTFLSKLMAGLELANYGVDNGTANTYHVVFANPVTVIYDGLKLRFKAINANNGASTFAPSSLSPVQILTQSGAALTGNEIIANTDVEVVWNSSFGTGGAWVLLTNGGSSMKTARFGYAQLSSVTVPASSGGTVGSVSQSLTFTAPSSGILNIWAATNESASGMGAWLVVNGVTVCADIQTPCVHSYAITVAAGSTYTITHKCLNGNTVIAAASLYLNYLFVQGQ